MVVSTARIPMHRQPKFKKMLATLATWQLLMISMSYPLPGVAMAWQPLATARERYENRLPRLPGGCKTLATGNTLILKDFKDGCHGCRGCLAET